MPAPLPPLPAADLDHVLAHTRKLWPAARGTRFFITGGTGFFGTWLLESFARANDSLGLGMRAVVLTRDPVAFARKAPHLAARADLEWVAGDMRNFTFPPGQFPFVIHAASDTTPASAGSDPASAKDAIVAGTERVLAFAAQAGTRKLLLTSSGAVYGPQPPGLTHIPEDYIGRPTTGYGHGKLRSEELCLEHTRRHGCEVKIARCFAFVGPHLPQDAHYAIGNFIRDGLAGGPIRVTGDGTPRRSYLYGADLAVWLWTMLFVAPAGRIYNVGSAADASIADIAHAVARALGRPVSVEILAAPQPGSPCKRYVPGVDRAGSELGLRVQIPLDEAIHRTLAWHRAGHAAKSL
jgi:nucleoside-diphosphate-sugar epimerase